MATKQEIDKALEALKEDVVRVSPKADVETWQVINMPTQTWGLCRVKGDQIEYMHRLGDTKGEALTHLQAMRAGLGLALTAA